MKDDVGSVMILLFLQMEQKKNNILKEYVRTSVPKAVLKRKWVI